ncbi:MAG: NUDIX domain-containing protein [Anaerolineales bacterium]|nr:NUDIX domain-containing protein [Anaerolineales bacterium]
MREEKIRQIAICVCRDGDRILVAEGHDSKKGQTFYRPLGGAIDFGERGAEAVRREFREEIAAELTDVRYVGMLENIFTYEGQRGHHRLSWSTMAACPTPACMKKEPSRAMSWVSLSKLSGCGWTSSGRGNRRSTRMDCLSFLEFKPISRQNSGRLSFSRLPACYSNC